MAQIPGNARVNQYTAIAGQTVFIYDYLIYNDDEIRVQNGDTILILITDYTVQDAGEEGGGTITLVVGAAADAIITLTGNSMIERDTEFTNGGDYLASAINGEYDKLDNITKEIVTDQTGNFRLSVYNEAVSKLIPTPSSKRALMWNAAGNALENSMYDPDLAQGNAAASAAAALVSETNSAASAAAALVSETDAAESAVEAAESAASINPTSFGSDLIPDEDGARTLGSTAKRWKEVHVGEAFVEEDLAVVGSVDVEGNVTAATFNGAPLPTQIRCAEVRMQVAYNVAGGTATSGAWNPRFINTIHADDIGINLYANKMVLPPGNYKYNGTATSFNTQHTTYRLYMLNPTQVELGRGSTYYYANGTAGTINGMFTLETAAEIQFQYYCTTTISTRGQGEATNTSGMGYSVFLQLRLEKY